MDNLDWLSDIKEKVLSFLMSMQDDDFSYVRYTYQGDLYGKEDNWGLGNYVFATKTAYISDNLTRLSANQRANLVRGIQKFIHKNGYIYDGVLTKRKLKSLIINTLKNSRDDYIRDQRRAESRQSIAALYLLNSKPNTPFIDIPYTENKVERYLSSMPWGNPWHSGSHLSHLLFFLYTNIHFFNYGKENYEIVKATCTTFLNSIQSNEDGCWYVGNPNLKIKINGAMKVLTGFQVVGINDFPYPKKLIDTALKASNDNEACSNFNVIYVLYCCHLIEPDYKRSEIEKFFLNRLSIYKKYYFREQGGFSFHPEKSSERYYRSKVSTGENCPDIHGTALFIWGLCFIDKVLKLNLGFKIPLN